MNKAVTIVLVVVLILALVGAVGYIVWDRFNTNKIAQLNYVFQQGQQQGINGAVVQIYQQTENCQPLPLTIGNVSKYVIDLSCVQQA